MNVPIEINNDKWEQNMIVTSATSYNVVLGNDWLLKVKGAIDFKKRSLKYEQDSEINYTPISCWQKFKDPQKVYEIENFKENKMFELELEEMDFYDFLEEEQTQNKVQIEANDTLLQITEEKKTVIGQLDKKQREQLQKLLQKYEGVIP